MPDTTTQTVIARSSVTVTLAKAEPVSNPGELWWTLSSDKPEILPPLGMVRAAAATSTHARAVASHYLAAAGLLPAGQDQPLLPWRTIGYTLDGSDAFQIIVTALVTAE